MSVNPNQQQRPAGRCPEKFCGRGGNPAVRQNKAPGCGAGRQN